MTLRKISTRRTSPWCLFQCRVSACPRAVSGKPFHKGATAVRPCAYKLSTAGRCPLRDDRRGVRHGPGGNQSIENFQDSRGMSPDKFRLWSSIRRTFGLICDSVGTRLIMITPFHVKTVPSPRKLTLEMLAKVDVIVAAQVICKD